MYIFNITNYLNIEYYLKILEILKKYLKNKILKKLVYIYILLQTNILYILINLFYIIIKLLLIKLFLFSLIFIVTFLNITYNFKIIYIYIIKLTKGKNFN